MNPDQTKELPGEPKARGKVKWFDCKKGFGFIIGPGGTDVFVHYKVIEGQGFLRLTDGEWVEYAAVPTARGLLATHVKRVAMATAALAIAEMKTGT